jgi:hypothetical protein
MDGNMKWLGFNAKEVEPAGDFTPIPEGEYVAIITASEFKATKAAEESGKPEDGQYLLLTLQLVDDPFAGRTVFDRLNLVNKSDQAVEIAKKQLSSICRAIGRMTPEDSSQLHNIPLLVRLGQKTHEGKVYNEVKSYKSAKTEQDPEATHPPAPTDPKPQPATAGAGKPWASKSKAPWAK